MSVRMECFAPRFELPRDPKPAQTDGKPQPEAKPQTLWTLAGSASSHDKTLIVTVVNPHATQARACELSVRGARVVSGRARVLTSTDLKAHNSFANPDALIPRDTTVTAGAGPLVHTFAPASVTRLQLDLA